MTQAEKAKVALIILNAHPLIKEFYDSNPGTSLYGGISEAVKHFLNLPTLNLIIEIRRRRLSNILGNL